jgi:hypothetical protein
MTAELRPAPDDSCRAVDVDGETIRVRGVGELTEQGRAALAEVIGAAKRKYGSEHPAERLTVDTITSDQLDALYDERDALRQQLDAAHRRHDALDSAVYALGPIVDRPFRSHRQQPAALCEQHPGAPVIGGICGGCTQYPSDMTKGR